MNKFNILTIDININKNQKYSNKLTNDIQDIYQQIIN